MLFSSGSVMFFVGLAMTGGFFMLQFRNEPVSDAYELGRDIAGVGAVGLIGLALLHFVNATLPAGPLP